VPTCGGLCAWEFEKGGRELKVRVEGQLVLNSTGQMLEGLSPYYPSRRQPSAAFALWSRRVATRAKRNSLPDAL